MNILNQKKVFDSKSLVLDALKLAILHMNVTAETFLTSCMFVNRHMKIGLCGSCFSLKILLASTASSSYAIIVLTSRRLRPISQNHCIKS